mmetsp:Transcript_7158/g.25944  ORF Transcript_7158/g.25944 Transcript_7158/m.25944 type:complete len:411 (-) Transcript_7158:345-1577(-)
MFLSCSLHFIYGSAAFPEDFDDGLEGEPLWDVLPGPEHLPELRSGELLDGEALVRSDVGGDVALLLGVHDVQRRHGLDPELLAVGLGEVLGVVGAVKVLAIQAGLAAGHVPADDEVGAPVVLPDDHVLDGLPGSGHVHRVGQVGPVHLWVRGLLLEDLVGPVPDDARDVVVLGGAAGRVDQDHAVVPDVLGVQGPGEQLVVRLVHRVAALEGHDVDVGGEHGPHLGGGLAGEDPRGELQTVNLSSHVRASPLHGDHLDSRVLERGGAVALLRLQRLVGLVGGLDLHDGEVLAVVREQDLHSRGEGVVVGVHDDGKAEEQAAREPHGLHHGLVLLLVHEPLERGEPSDHQELHVAGVPVAELDGPALARRDQGGALARVGHHEADELAAVRNGLALRHRRGELPCRNRRHR